jgi:hypothetical protein
MSERSGLSDDNTTALDVGRFKRRQFGVIGVRREQGEPKLRRQSREVADQRGSHEASTTILSIRLERSHVHRYVYVPVSHGSSSAPSLEY